MARINIEEEWFSDMRRTRLIQLVGNAAAADGLALMAWRLALQFWIKRELIPEHAWKGAGFGEELFECGLAERRPEGVYVRGASRHFDWYHKKINNLKVNAASGGKKSAELRRLKYGTAQPNVKNPEANPNRARSKPEANSSNPSPSSSSSSSSSSSKDKNRVGTPQTPTAFHSVIFELWNKLRGPLPECRGLSEKRRRAATSRWKDKPDESYWVKVITEIRNSKFCNGENDRGWRADFDFLVRPDTHLKVMEGKYRGRLSAKEIMSEADQQFFKELEEMRKNL